MSVLQQLTAAYFRKKKTKVGYFLLITLFSWTIITSLIFEKKNGIVGKPRPSGILQRKIKELKLKMKDEIEDENF